MKHIRLFKTAADYESATLDLPNLSYVEETDTVFCKPFIDYSKEYLTIQSLEDNNEVYLSNLSANNIMYQQEGSSTWSTFDTGEILILNTNQEVKFKINNPTITEDGICRFSASKKCNLKGNIMSLLYGDDFIGKKDLTGKNYAFYKLFYKCTNIVDASELILPATTLAENCYEYMFKDCTSLTTAPELPATTLADFCYSGMFEQCTSLVTAPELPATTLTDYCYTGMFLGCWVLTTAPELPATTLVEGCYSYMFQYCYDLSYIKMLAIDISVDYCLEEWVIRVSSTGTFVKNKDATWNVTGVSGIPEGWTVETV